MYRQMTATLWQMECHFLMCTKATLDTEAQTGEESLPPYHSRHHSIHIGSSSPLPCLWGHSSPLQSPLSHSAPFCWHNPVWGLGYWGDLDPSCALQPGYGLLDLQFLPLRSGLTVPSSKVN